MVLLLQVFFVALFLAWFWALFDCLCHESGPNGQRLPWLLVILFGAGFGALIYLAIRRPQRRRASRQAEVEQTDSALEDRLQQHRQRWQRGRASLKSPSR